MATVTSRENTSRVSIQSLISAGFKTLGNLLFSNYMFENNNNNNAFYSRAELARLKNETSQLGQLW